jgi:hypothetical protein
MEIPNDLLDGAAASKKLSPNPSNRIHALHPQSARSL